MGHPRRVGFNARISKPVKPSLLLDVMLQSLFPSSSPASTTPGSFVEQHEHVSEDTPSSSSARVLLVEDNQINQEVAINILKSAGYRVAVARNGKEAVQQVQNRSYDLILMDCQMPEMDGYEATRVIRGMERDRSVAASGASRIPIIALTANALAQDRQRCLDAGMDDHVAKPLERKPFLEVIQRHLMNLASPTKTGTETSMEATTPVVTATESIPSSAFDVPSLVERCMGKLDLMEKVIQKFQSEGASLVEQIFREVDAGAVDAVAKLTHKLKGMAANLSAARVRHIAGELEALARNNEDRTFRAVLATLQQEFQQCLDDVPRVLHEIRNLPAKT